MILSLHFLEQLDEALKERRIGEGIGLLEHAGVDWTSPDIERGGAAIALRAAQWWDVGHRDRKSVESLLARFPPCEPGCPSVITWSCGWLRLFEP
jgi:hypothetical protein